MKLHHSRRKAQTNKWHRFVDKIIYPSALTGSAMTIIQAAKIWLEKDAAGVSILAWTGYLFLALIWISYGLIHKEKPLILAKFFGIIGYALIVAGAFLYG